MVIINYYATLYIMTKQLNLTEQSIHVIMINAAFLE